MVTEQGSTEARYQVARFFEDKFYSALGDNEKALLQLASVFQKPFPNDAIPRELRQARKGSMLREVMPGKLEIHSSLRGFVYDIMTKEERYKWHSSAADYYMRSGDQQERLYHLLRANRRLEAEMALARLDEQLLCDGNIQRLWTVLSDIEPSRPKYSSAVNILKAKTASLVGEYGIAVGLLEKEISDGSGVLKADALIEMGKIKSKQGELGSARKLFSDALEQDDSSLAVRARALRGLGVIENKLGEYAKAQELLESSAMDSMSAMDSKGMLLAHMELGNVFIGRGMHEKAIEHFSKCAAGFGPVDLVNVYINMGIACAHLDRIEEAKINLENAISLADDTGQPRAKAYGLTSLAEVLTRTGDPEAAMEQCYKAIEILSELDDPLGMSAAYANLGIAERAKGDMDSCVEHLEESLRAMSQMEAPRRLAQRKLEVGTIMLEIGQGDRGRALLDEARKAFADVDADDMVQAVDTVMSRDTGPQ
jgi:tetratricopeptide (TPR) repeat protein